MSSSVTHAPQGCQFLNGHAQPFFAPEDFVGDDLLMIQTAEQFSRKEILPLIDRMEQQESGLTPSLIRKAGELGFCGIDTSDKYGGLGLGKNLAARILEFLSLNGSFSVTIGITSGISQVGLSMFGSEHLRQRYLPQLTSGEQIGAYCLSEPNSGTDALSMSTRADEKDGKWVLNGTKMWISNAQWAEQFLVMAKVGGEKVTAFLVERGHPGVSISREEHKLGLKGSSTARVILDNAEIPLENMVFEEGRGHIVAFNALNLGRFKLASMSLGPARDAFSHAIAYSQDRKQFGQPIANFGLIQKKLAEMTARYFAAEAMIYRTGSLIDSAFEFHRADSSKTELQQNLAACEEFSVECSLCKVFATEAEAFIIDEALQIYGGYGFTEEFPIARHYRDCRVSRIYEGTNEINRFFIADRFLRKLRDGKATVDHGDSFVGELTTRAVQFCHNRSDLSQIHLGALADLLLLSYAEQSSRLRAARHHAYAPIAALVTNWINAQAAYAAQFLLPESLTLPQPTPTDHPALAQLAIQQGGPVLLS
jgi:alkylation response protein AidB-like acyl-CoA dehydrogenase